MFRKVLRLMWKVKKKTFKFQPWKYNLFFTIWSISLSFSESSSSLSGHSTQLWPAVINQWERCFSIQRSDCARWNSAQSPIILNQCPSRVWPFHENYLRCLTVVLVCFLTFISYLKTWCFVTCVLGKPKHSAFLKFTSNYVVELKENKLANRTVRDLKIWI